MNHDEKSLYISQIQTDVSLISFLAVISVFFLGSLLTQFNSYDTFIKIPISFLIISTFGFIFAALILSNTTQEIIAGKLDKVKKHVLYGYAISEYLGVYLFILSIPLEVNIITTNIYLEVTSLVATLLGLFFYQFMGFSIIEKHLPKSYRAFSVFTVFFGVILFISQLSRFYFTEISIVFLLFILLTTILALRDDFQ